MVEGKEFFLTNLIEESEINLGLVDDDGSEELLFNILTK